MTGFEGRPMRDAHLHLPDLGAELSCVQLAGCGSCAEALERVAARAAESPDGAWVMAVGARPEGWSERAFPTAAQLDEAAGGRPVVVRSFDHHALAASSAALALAGVDGSTAQPENGHIERRDGAPTGLLLENACELIWRVAPEQTPDQRRASVLAALRELRARGFVEVHDMLSPSWLGPLLAELADAGDPDALAVRVWLYAPLERVEPMLEASEHWTRPTVRLAGAKIFLDGTLNSRTAHMLEPYAEPHPDFPNGRAFFTPERLDAAISRADILGLPIAMHAIGDGAVRSALDAVERVRPETFGARIEHCQFTHPDDAPRFAALSVIASMQPCHLLADVEALRRLTPDRLDRAFACRSIVEGAIAAGYAPEEILWLGSDAPIVPASVEDNLQAACARRRAGAPGSEAIAPDQAIDRELALRCAGSPGAEEREGAGAPA